MTDKLTSPTVEATRKQWDAAAEGWDAQSAALAAWLSKPTQTMFDLAGVEPGDASWTWPPAPVTRRLRSGNGWACQVGSLPPICRRCWSIAFSATPFLLASRSSKGGLRTPRCPCPRSTSSTQRSAAWASCSCRAGALPRRCPSGVEAHGLLLSHGLRRAGSESLSPQSHDDSFTPCRASAARSFCARRPSQPRARGGPRPALSGCWLRRSFNGSARGAIPPSIRRRLRQIPARGRRARNGHAVTTCTSRSGGRVGEYSRPTSGFYAAGRLERAEHFAHNDRAKVMSCTAGDNDQPFARSEPLPVGTPSSGFCAARLPTSFIMASASS